MLTYEDAVRLVPIFALILYRVWARAKRKRLMRARHIFYQQMRDGIPLVDVAVQGEPPSYSTTVTW